MRVNYDDLNVHELGISQSARNCVKYHVLNCIRYHVLLIYLNRRLPQPSFLLTLVWHGTISLLFLSRCSVVLYPV